MAKNPMQRKAQNSFLLGMLITLLITGAIIALLVLQLTKMIQEQKKAEEARVMKSIYVINQDIASGESVTVEKLTQKEMDSAIIPNNSLTPAELESKTNILDDDGNLVKKVDVISKIDLKKGTIITTDMIAETSELASDLREQEYNMILLTSRLETNQYVDIRLRLPNGKDYIVVSHKKVTIPEIDGNPSTDTISLKLSEVETLTLSCAIVESYKAQGSILYTSRYIEPGLQEAATPTYLPDDGTINLISKNPNCVLEAKNELIKRNNDAANKAIVRNPINSQLTENKDKANDNAIKGLEAEIQKAQEERQKYLESLGE